MVLLAVDSCVKTLAGIPSISATAHANTGLAGHRFHIAQRENARQVVPFPSGNLLLPSIIRSVPASRARS